MNLDNLIKKMSKSNFYYILETVTDYKRFYLYDIDENDDINQVLWTPNIKRALAFEHEEEIEDIKSSYRSLGGSIVVRVGKSELTSLTR